MILTGAIVNGIAVAAGGFIGLLLKKGIPSRMGETIMKGMSLCVIYIGISGSLVGENIIIAIISIAAGTVIGEAIDLDLRLNQLGNWLQRKMRTKDTNISIAEGFVTCSLLICVGAMAIVGSIQSGITGDHSTLYAKSLIDGIAAAVLASTLGIGVVFSGIFCMLYESIITLSAQFLEPFLTQTVINEMTCVGSLLIVGVGINMIFKDKIRVMNCVPAIFIPIILCRFM